MTTEGGDPLDRECAELCAIAVVAVLGEREAVEALARLSGDRGFAEGIVPYLVPKAMAARAAVQHDQFWSDHAR